MVLEIPGVEPIYPEYSGVIETCLALRYWFFEVLGSESVNYKQNRYNQYVIQVIVNSHGQHTYFEKL